MALFTSDELLDKISPRSASGENPFHIDEPAQPASEPAPDTWTTIKNSFVLENDVGAVINRAAGTGNLNPSTVIRFNDEETKLNPAYNPFESDRIKGYEDYADEFIWADSDEDVNKVKSFIDDLNRRRDIHNESGIIGTITDIVAGVASPTVLLPVTKIIAAGTKARAAVGFAAGVGYGAGATAIQEGALQASDPTRENDAIMAKLLIGGMIGGIVGGAASALSKQSIEKAVEDITERVYTQPNVRITPEEIVEPRSAGAAEISLEDRIKFYDQEKAAEGLADISETTVKIVSPSKAFRGPSLRGVLDEFSTVRRFSNEMVEHNFILGKTKQGQATNAAESYIKQDIDAIVKQIDEIVPQVKQYYQRMAAEGKTPVSKVEFNREIARAMARNDYHVVPEIQNAARILRRIADKTEQQLIELEKLTTGFEDKFGYKYAHQQWNKSAIFDRELDAKQAFYDIYKARAENIGKTDFQIKQDVDETIRNIKGLGDREVGAGPMLEGIRTRTPSFLKERKLHFSPDELDRLDEFMVHDAIGQVQAAAIKVSAAKRVSEALQRLGYKSVDDVKRELKAEYEARNAMSLKANKPGKEREKLFTKYKESKQLIDDLYNVTAGTFKQKTKYDDSMAVFRQAAFATRLQNVVLSSLTDVVAGAVHSGVPRHIFDTIIKPLSNIKLTNLSKNELEDLAMAAQRINAEEYRNLLDPDINYGELPSKLKQRTNKANKLFGKIYLIEKWTRWGRRGAAYSAESQALRALLKFEQGIISKYDRERLVQFGLDNQSGYYKKILEQFRKHGDIKNRIAKFDKWDADAEEAKQAFARYIRKYTDSTITIPGKGDIPLFVQKHDAAKIFFMFKNFGASLIGRLIIPSLQRKDVQAASGILSLIAVGMLSAKLKMELAGRSTDGWSEIDWIRQGVDASGVAGLMYNDYLARSVMPTNVRFYDNDGAEVLGGPAVRIYNDVRRIVSAPYRGKWGAQEDRALKGFIPVINNLVLKRAFQEMFGESPNK